MKNNNLILFGLFAILTALSSCTHYYYAPNSHNVPLFQKQNEARISVATSRGDEFEGTEIQSAYSITKNVGLMLNGFYVNPQDGSEWGKGNLVEFGVGYFKPMGKYFVFETYGGFGKGKAINQYGLGKSTAKFSRYFVQPSIGFTTPWFDIAASSRFCWLDFYKIEYDKINLNDIVDLDYIKDHNSSFLFEPALTVRGGWKYIKFQMQLVLSKNLTTPELQQEKVNFNIGVYAVITDKYRSKP